MTHNFYVKLKYVLFKTISRLGIRYGTVNSFKIPIYSKTWKYLFKEIFVNKIYDFDSASDAPVILDCGANIGFSSLFFLNRYPKAQITAFEAAFETYKRCLDTFEVNNINNVNLVQKALSDSDNQKVSFYQNSEDGCDLGAALTSIKKSRSEIVETARLSHFINGPVDYLKLDVEGAETLVIKDIAQSKKLDLIKEGLIEFHLNSANKSNDLSFILSKLTEYNFEYRFLACDKFSSGWPSQAILIRFKKLELIS